ncbi:MAG: hypothetical protein EOP05_07030 [Proteobacteria bacterium]|nr:MAG: hypothetical protein EOP05_07030 [Pseudomonadota bacterium]
MLVCKTVNGDTLKNSIEDVKRLFPLVIKRTWFPLLVLHFGKEISLQLLNYAGLMVQREGREDIGLLVAVVGTNFFFEILWSAVWSFAAISATRAALRDEPVFSSRSLTDLNQLLIEGVRSMAAVVFRLPLLLIPAAVEVLRLLFVPHVVILDRVYQVGQADALKRSRTFARLGWLPLLISTLLVFSTGILIDSVTQGASGEAWLWQRPGAFLLSALLTLFINLVYEVFLVALFLRLTVRIADSGENHAHVQLETS